MGLAVLSPFPLETLSQALAGPCYSPRGLPPPPPPPPLQAECLFFPGGVQPLVAHLQWPLVLLVLQRPQVTSNSLLLLLLL